jgi:hypothetical protein
VALLPPLLLLPLRVLVVVLLRHSMLRLHIIWPMLLMLIGSKHLLQQQSLNTVPSVLRVLQLLLLREHWLLLLLLTLHVQLLILLLLLLLVVLLLAYVQLLFDVSQCLQLLQQLLLLPKP